MESFDYIIIGSGVSGMGFARRAASAGKSVLVLEKKEYAGGCLRTLRHDGFWLELGGHTIYNSYSTFIKTLRELELDSGFHPREKASFKMYKDGKILPLTSSLSKLELAINLPRMLFTRKEGHTVRQYYSAILGKGNYENFFSSMMQAVISQDASDFPADMLLKKRVRDKTAPKNFTISNGMSTFIENVAGMENITVMTDSEAVEITHNDSIYTAETQKGERFSTENLVMACPPPVAGKLLSKTVPDTAEMLSGIKGVKVESLGVIVNKQDMELEPFSFIIAKNDTFTSAVSRDIIPHDKYRGVAFHFRDGALDREEKISKIEDVLGIDRGSIAASAETVHFSPTLGADHKKTAEKIDSTLKAHKGLYVVGNYFGGVAIEDCSLRAQSEFRRA